MTPATNPDGLTADEVAEHLQTALSSAPFVRAPRLQRFLRFVADAALQEREADLKEYLIAVSVYDRPASFDPTEHSLVRVEANRLRSRLASYYEGPGRGATVEIHLPRGSYAPVFRRRHPRTAAPPHPITERSGAVAVLPFVSLSPDIENEYFADGLTEELIVALSQAPDLSVVARTSSFQFKNRAADAREIGRRLDARWILDGSVRRSGTRLRVTARLVDATTGQQVWSERLERGMRDVFDVQDEITSAVVASLHRRLAAPAVLGRRTNDLQAYQLYLTGRYHWNKRTPPALRKSVICFREAIARDPRWPLPYCGLADAYGVQALNGLVSPAEALREGTAAATRAIELDPELADAQTSLAFLLSTLHWDWTAGEAAFRRAVTVRPGDAGPHYLYGMTNLGPQGRWMEALREMEHALALDPVALPVMRDYGVLLLFRRDYDAAFAQFRLVEEIDPTFVGTWYWMGRLHEEQGRLEDALAAYERRRAAGEANARLLASIAGVRAAMGDAAFARRQLARFEAEGNVSPLARATLHMRLGDRTNALELLELACAERRPELYQLKVDPLYDDLRGDERFAALLARLNLAAATPAPNR
jgi:TolB-like protein/Tfp pilus assembly protein PilF